MIENGEEMKED